MTSLLWFFQDEDGTSLLELKVGSFLVCLVLVLYS